MSLSFVLVLFYFQPVIKNSFLPTDQRQPPQQLQAQLVCHSHRKRHQGMLLRIRLVYAHRSLGNVVQ